MSGTLRAGDNPYPALGRLLVDPSSFFSPQPKELLGRLYTWIGWSENDSRLAALAQEVKKYHGETLPENFQLESTIEKINSLDLPDYQKRAVHKLATEVFMKSTCGDGYTYEIYSILSTRKIEDVERFIQGNTPDTLHALLRALRLLDITDFFEPENIKFLMTLYDGGKCDSLILLGDEESHQSGRLFLKALVNLFKVIGGDGKEAGELVAPFVQNINFEDREELRIRISVIKDEIQHISTTGRKPFLKVLAPLFQGLESFETRILVTAMMKIPERERQQLINNASSLWQTTPSGSSRADILSQIDKIPQTDRQQAIADAAPVFQAIGGKGQAFVAGAISKITQPARDQMVLAISAIFQGGAPEVRWLWYSEIESLVTSISERGPTTFMQEVSDAALLTQNYPKVTDRLRIVRLVSQIDPTIKDQAVLALSAILQGRNDSVIDSDVEAIVTWVKQKGLTNFTQAVSDAAPLLIFYMTDLSLQMVEAVSRISPEYRAEVVTEVASMKIISQREERFTQLNQVAENAKAFHDRLFTMTPEDFVTYLTEKRMDFRNESRILMRATVEQKKLYLAELEKKLPLLRSGKLWSLYLDANELKSALLAGVQDTAFIADVEYIFSTLTRPIMKEEDYLCPISRDFMVDPVLARPSCQIYDEHWIKETLKSNKNDPTTGQFITSLEPIPELKEEIDAFVKTLRPQGEDA